MAMKVVNLGVWAIHPYRSIADAAESAKYLGHRGKLSQEPERGQIIINYDVEIIK
jgi:hypothetical protein